MHKALCSNVRLPHYVSVRRQKRWEKMRECDGVQLEKNKGSGFIPSFASSGWFLGRRSAHLFSTTLKSFFIETHKLISLFFGCSRRRIEFSEIKESGLARESIHKNNISCRCLNLDAPWIDRHTKIAEMRLSIPKARILGFEISNFRLSSRQ